MLLSSPFWFGHSAGAGSGRLQNTDALERVLVPTEKCHTEEQKKPLAIPTWFAPKAGYPGPLDTYSSIMHDESRLTKSNAQSLPLVGAREI